MNNTVSFLICILALLVGVLIGKEYRKWKNRKENQASAPSISKRAGKKTDK